MIGVCRWMVPDRWHASASHTQSVAGSRLAGRMGAVGDGICNCNGHTFSTRRGLGGRLWVHGIRMDDG